MINTGARSGNQHFTVWLLTLSSLLLLILPNAVSYRWEISLHDCPCGHDTTFTIDRAVACKADDGSATIDTFCDIAKRPNATTKNCPATDECLARIKNITDCVPVKDWAYANSMCAVCAATINLNLLELKNVPNATCDEICEDSDGVCVSAFRNPNPFIKDQCFQQKVACSKSFATKGTSSFDSGTKYNTNVTCQCTKDYKKLYAESQKEDPAAKPELWYDIVWRIAVSTLLILLSGLFSGLTLGLCGLDITQLKIIIDADPTSTDAINAKKIYPLRKDGNLLLCTLLLGNVAVNSALAIILGDLTSGPVGFVISTGVIVILGEIVPQSVCSRYALAIGGRSVPLVILFTVLLYIAAKPIALVLDKILGEEMGTVHNRRQLIQLVRFHENAKAIDHDAADILKGALLYQTKQVSEIMTPLEKCFMLREDTPLNFDIISRVFQLGHSRIPVYSQNASSEPPTNPNDIVGLLFTKDLILLDPEDATMVKDVVSFFSRTIHKVSSDQQLGHVLTHFKEGNTHMSMVVEVNTENEDIDPFYELKGVVTMEDVIEEILGSEILDETDQFIHIEKDQQADNEVNRKRFDFAQLRLWGDKKSPLLESTEVQDRSLELMPITASSEAKEPAPSLSAVLLKTKYLAPETHEVVPASSETQEPKGTGVAEGSADNQMQYL